MSVTNKWRRGISGTARYPMAWTPPCTHLRGILLGAAAERSGTFCSAPPLVLSGDSTARHWSAKAASIMVLMTGPATSAPVADSDWWGMTTAMATLGLVAGAKAII